MRSQPTISPLRLPTRVSALPTNTPFAITAQAYYDEGIARREAGDLEGALQSLTWAIQRAPYFAPAYVTRGTIHLARGDLRLALADADAALDVDPQSAAAHSLRGETLRLLNRHTLALEALVRAVTLAPDLAEGTFRSRWLASRAAHDASSMLKLSHEYALAHPDDPLRTYYRGWGWIESSKPDVAIRMLAETIEAYPDPPALLWFTLGLAYAETNSWTEAVTSLEATRALVQVGDMSLALHSTHPISDLFGALGLAYLRSGRCVDAETMLSYAIEIGASQTEAGRLLAEARICQTPTPTVTPYPTVTPHTEW